MVKGNIIKTCTRCKRERKVISKGLCASCYSYLHHSKDNQTRINKKWQKAHLDYWRKYNKIRRDKLRKLIIIMDEAKKLEDSSEQDTESGNASGTHALNQNPVQNKIKLRRI